MAVEAMAAVAMAAVAMAEDVAQRLVPMAVPRRGVGG